MDKKAKAEYDKEYRRKNRDRLILKRRKYYEENKKLIYSRQRAKRDNDEARAKHAEYNRKPEQREKERHRRYARLYGKDWRNQKKHCIGCDEQKFFLEFPHFSVFPDDRSYLCNQCEDDQKKKYGYSTRGVMTAMVMRRYTNLTRGDIAEHPYLIEANKFLILLKQLTK